MEDKGISADSYATYERQHKRGDTELSYKEWLKK
jgi:hypothetical protein